MMKWKITPATRLLWTCLRTDTRLVKILFSTRGCLSREAKIKVPNQSRNDSGSAHQTHTKKSLLSKNIANNISFLQFLLLLVMKFRDQRKTQISDQIRSTLELLQKERKGKEQTRTTWLQPNLCNVVPVLQRGDGPLPRSELLMVSRRRRCGSLVHTLVTAHHTRTFLWTPSTE